MEIITYNLQYQMIYFYQTDQKINPKFIPCSICSIYFIFRDNKSNFVWKYCFEGGKTGYKIWINLTQSGKLKCGQFLRFVTTSDLFVQMSVFVKFIGFPKTGYLDITAVYHDTIQI